jgi:hypothetical protein
MAMTNIERDLIINPPQSLLDLIYKSKSSDPMLGRDSLTIMQAIIGFAMPPDGSVGQGERNDFLAKAAGHFLKHTRDEATLFEILNLVNSAKCMPPLSLSEVENVAKSIDRYRTPIQTAPLVLGDGKIILTSLLPNPRKTVWGDMVFDGKYSVLAGPGGTSKTMLALSLASQVVIGKDWAGQKISKGSALLILGEEDSDEVHRRVNAIARHFSQNEQAELTRGIRVIPACGKDLRLVRLNQSNPEPTDLDNQIIAMVEQLGTESGNAVRLIVIDHARLVGAGDTNDASHVTELTRVLTSIADRTGAAVLLIGHSPKSVHGKASEELSSADVVGSGAYVDNSRSALLMTSLSEADSKKFGIIPEARLSYARLQVVKNNYGATGTTLYFKREHDPDYQVSVLIPVNLVPVPKKATRQHQLAQKIIDLLALSPKPISKTELRDKYSGVDRGLGASESDVRKAVKEMLEDGRLVERKPTDDERKVFRLSPNIRSVLVLGAWPGEGCRDGE